MMTQLYPGRLAPKDDPVIRFRGKLDTLTAMILEAQVLGAEKGNCAFAEDLQEALAFARGLFAADYSGRPLGELRILGMGADELREQSHHPEKYFGRPHLLTDCGMGALSVRLNLLRAAARETEAAAVTAFPDRPDIVEALNRLSSLFYILMYRYLPQGWDGGRWPAGGLVPPVPPVYTRHSEE
jgi:ethanolamine utilization cobalamin adenosyltransferase